MNIDARNITYLQQMMYVSIAVGLYINILSIDTNIFKTCFNSIAKVVLVGVPIKIVLPGFLLSLFSPHIAPIAYLCSTVIAQIDPIAADKFLENSKISKKSETILRAWSSFDDPITVLFAFYIFLPALLLTNFNIKEYLIKIVLDIFSCLLVYSFYFIYKRNIKTSTTYQSFVQIILIVAIIIYSVVFNSFILPAVAGLFLRPFAPEKFSIINSGIFYISAIILGIFAANIQLDWYSGLILAASTFFLAQVFVTFIFIKDSIESKSRVMFGHQNGMTAMLLTVAIEISASQKTDELLGVTLPAIVWVAVFYFGVNYLLNLCLPASHEA
ncbi:MAG: hypothetical protein SWZ49_28425 [Cyanobacteriota bacterium]|nr:hypothetical protein [Cyanobacteriota bacterium]